MQDKNSRYLNHFSAADKIFARAAFSGLFILGGIALVRVHPLGTVIYLAAALSTVMALAVKWFCPLCPYPSEFNDCLFFPTAVIRRFSRYRTAGKKKPNTAAASLTLGLLILFPQYWLIQSWPLFLLFWILMAFVGFRTSRYLCRHCRFIRCPLNKGGQTDHSCPETS